MYNRKALKLPQSGLNLGVKSLSAKTTASGHQASNRIVPFPSILIQQKMQEASVNLLPPRILIGSFLRRPTRMRKRTSGVKSSNTVTH